MLIGESASGQSLSCGDADSLTDRLASVSTGQHLSQQD
jgi:hypothetical protein